MRRVFFLGQTKTGTSTIRRTMTSVGFKTMQHGPWRGWSQRKAKAKFKNAKHTCFNGHGGCNYEWLNETFSNSFFILNTRPLKSWMTSRWNMVKSRQEKHGWKNGIDPKTGKDIRKTISITSKEKAWRNDEDIMLHWIMVRNKQHENIINYFGGKENFGIIDLTLHEPSHILPILERATQKKVPKILNQNIQGKKDSYVKEPKEIINVLDRFNIGPEHYNAPFIEDSAIKDSLMKAWEKTKSLKGCKFY